MIDIRLRDADGVEWYSRRVSERRVVWVGSPHDLQIELETHELAVRGPFTFAPAPVTGVVPVPDSPADILARWWRDHAEAEIDMVVAKAIEYGARDLKVMGHELAAMAGREIDDEEAAELGCAMYLAGKMARVTAAIAEGRRPSTDTYLDIGIYTRMVQRIREVGAWPGV